VTRSSTMRHACLAGSLGLAAAAICCVIPARAQSAGESATGDAQTVDSIVRALQCAPDQPNCRKSETLQAPPSDGKCPAKSATGSLAAKVTVFISGASQLGVTCSYSDGSRVVFQVNRGCDVNPVGLIVDGQGFGRHECREQEPGAGRCKIVCR
jgi:hypothetical protein